MRRLAAPPGSGLFDRGFDAQVDVRRTNAPGAPSETVQSSDRADTGIAVVASNGDEHPRPASSSLDELTVLVVDCQATAATTDGHLLEIGWAHLGRTVGDVRTHVIAVPDGVRIPPAVVRITGITDSLVGAGVSPCFAWTALAADAALCAQQPAPTVIHFARFEQPFLHGLALAVAGTARGARQDDRVPSCLDVVCTHEIARRLLPDLPRRSLRALAGYFGGAVSPLRRSSDHVRATALVWRELVALLAVDGVSTWGALQTWLEQPVARAKRRVFPMPRDLRLGLPDAPGVYRFLRTSGDVVYVGKAASLRDRVNSYFRQQHGTAERMLEMLSQARAISYEVTPTALEAALLEPGEIKRHRPPYNIALADDEARTLWFASPDLAERDTQGSPRCCTGPFPSPDVLRRFAALVQVDRRALAQGRSLPDDGVFAAGYARLVLEHRELTHETLDMPRRLLALGTRLWREGLRDRKSNSEEAPEVPPADRWTAELVQRALELIALRAAHARRRATWLTRLIEANVVWCEPGESRARLLVIANGDWFASEASDRVPPIPGGHARPRDMRQRQLTVARFDCLRVLTTELKRLSSNDAYAAVRFGAGPAVSGTRLAAALWWL